MKLIVGLGNPGEKYKNNRHNAGYMVVDEIKDKFKSKNIIAVKSGTFMNDSGSAVKKLATGYRIPATNLYVVHDDLDIPLGSYKIQFGTGPKDHKGINSIDEALGTDDYWRVRVGVDNRPLDGKPMGEEYVLQNFSEEERKILDKVIFEVCKKLATL